METVLGAAILSANEFEYAFPWVQSGAS